MKMEPPPKDFEELMNDNPWREGRLGLVVLGIFFGVFGLWAALAPLDAGVVAVGEVIVSGNRQVVQHREGGVISRIAVQEGDHVQAGQILIELSAVELAAQERAMAGQAIELEASRERLLAEAARSNTVERPASWSALPPEYVSLADGVLARHETELHARRTAVSAQTGVQGQRSSQLSARIAGYHEQIAAIDRQNVLITEELDGLRTLAAEGFAADLADPAAAALPKAPKSTFPKDRLIALLIRTERRKPEAPSSAPQMMSTLLPIAKPIADAASPA